jgi:hypothetical protein
VTDQNQKGLNNCHSGDDCADGGDYQNDSYQNRDGGHDDGYQMGSYQNRDGGHDDGYCGDPIHNPSGFHSVRGIRGIRDGDDDVY